MQIPVVRDILEQNDQVAQELQDLFGRKQILVLNMMSSPGAGKTSLLEQTLHSLKDEFACGVIEGDLQTSNDAERIAITGAQIVQINTDGGCHLSSNMIKKAVDQLDLDQLDVLFIENVGNLVCPAEFNLGEDLKITLLSVTEGDDKPEKYPYMFALSKVVLFNKVDLLPYVDFSLERAEYFARAVNHNTQVFSLSCRTGQGLDAWYDWLRQAAREKQTAG
ncbi:MAG: hydrogenase nickel incorporation protein HypB [Thermodesulfobacteriota bacterium]